MTPTDLTGILNTAIGALPSIVALIRGNHATAHPEAPPLTDADVFAALEHAVAATVAKGDVWKTAHPPTNDTGE